MKFLTREEVVAGKDDRGRASTISKYKKDGVPIQEIGEHVLDRLGSGFRLQKDDLNLRDVFTEVRKLYGLKIQHSREHDWRVLMSVLDLSPKRIGVRARNEQPGQVIQLPGKHPKD